MPIDFPNPPLTVGQQYPYDGTTWQWNGYAWIVVGTYPSIGDYVTTFNGLTGAVTGVTTGTANTFVALQSFSAGISAAGATLSSNTIIPSGSTLTVNGNFVANGNVNLGDAVTDAITVAGLLAANGGLSAAGGTFTALTRFTAGISAAGGTFSGLVTFNAGLSASGGTFANDISVNGIRVGLGVSNTSTNLAIGANAYNSGVTGFNNIGIGLNAVRDNTTGDANIGIGVSALISNTRGRANTAIGVAALQSLNSVTAGVGLAEYNVAIGSSALQNSTTASYNMSIGTSSLSNNTTGSENVAIGTFALIRNNTGNDNIAIGHQALGPGFGSANAVTENISIGWNSLFNTNTTTRNTAIGAEVGFRNTTGASNTLIGRRALYNNATGSNNIAIGAQAGEFANAAGATLQNSASSVFIGHLAASGNITSSNQIVIGANALGLGSNTAVIGATTQTSATIYGLLNAPSGISASGGTFSGNINLQNAEFIRNTTDGRIDFLPGPVSGTTYGLYMHFTNWGGGLNGVQFGTITSSTGVLDAASILYGTDLVIANTKKFSFGSSQRYQFSYQVGGGVTSALQLGLPAGVANDSAALALVDFAWVGNANRIPVTAHTNPNLYIYRAGAANANDFIRFEHNGTDGRIVSGGTSGISIEPGSGVVGISGGISASGGTFGGNINLQNAEFIRNSTNGRFDFMPAPAGSTHFGLYVDTTSWGFGVQIGTIRSSDGSLNTNGQILWNVPLVIGNGVNFGLGADQQYAISRTATGNDTAQFSVDVTTGTNSGAFAIVDQAGIGNSNRSPGVTHTNPNLYIYRAGTARANDFIRFEHNGTDGRIVSGGTSGISIEPGSGIVGVSGNIQVLENKIFVTNNARSWFL